MKNRFYLENSTYPIVDTYKFSISDNPEDNAILVDIGSCRGDFLALHKDKFAECFAFEASYENASLINKRIYEENWENCAVFNLAVSDKTGDIVSLKKADSGDAGSNSIIGGSTHNGLSQNAYTIKFNDIFEFLQIEEIDLLKMDCEGCEYVALGDADLSNIKIICMELHNWEGFTDELPKLKNKILITHDIYHEKGGGHQIITFVRKEAL
jgi:FkbM family methyltransferase